MSAGSIEVSFASGGVIAEGSTQTKDATSSEPKVKLDSVQPQQAYTLVMVDPDAPSKDNPTMR